MLKNMDEIKRFRNKNKEHQSFSSYQRRVKLLTEKVKHLIPEIEKRGFKAYHIDHKKSIYHGYKNGIDENDIADISNLRLIPFEDNLKKGVSCAETNQTK